MEVKCIFLVSKINCMTYLTLPSIFMISDSIEAIHNVWFIGDALLREIYNTYQVIKTKAEMSKKEFQPYMQEYYNVLAYFYASGTNNGRVIARLINSFVKGLNDRECIPKHVVFVLDNEIIEDINIFNYGAAKAITANLTWIMKQANILVHRKRLQILAKKPGALSNKSDPNIIFTRMLKRADFYPIGSKMESVCSLRGKFNEILSQAVAKQDQFLLQIKSCNTTNHFDMAGILSNKGKFDFWYEMDDLLECFDRNEVKLLPKLHLRAKPRNTQPYKNLSSQRDHYFQAGRCY